MNKDLLKDPCSDALNPSLSKEGNALFIVGGIRWIKRCSWWGWCVASVCVCVFFCLWASLSDYVWFRWHPECICVYIKSSLCVCVCVSTGWMAGQCPALPSPYQLVNWTAEEIKGKFYFLFFHRAFHILTDECVYWLRNKKQFRLVSQIIQLY